MKIIVVVPLFAVALALSACKTAPSTVANDVAIEANGLVEAFQNLPPGVELPAAASLALLDLSAEATAFAAADSLAAQQTVVQRIETDVNALVQAAGNLPGLPVEVVTAVQAAQVLLPIIEAEVDLAVAAPLASTPASMTPAQARMVLAASAS